MGSPLSAPSWEPGIPTFLLFQTHLLWLSLSQAAENKDWSVKIPVAAQFLLPNPDPLWLQDKS